MDRQRLLRAVAPVLAAAGVGGIGARKAPTIYAQLRKPSWAPPASAFGPVWSALYVMIAAAGYRIDDRTAARLHLVQLALNGAWPIAFFGGRDRRVSLGVIAGLDAVLAAEIIRLYRVDRSTAALLVPYAGWTAFATALNAAVSRPAGSRTSS